MFFNLQLVNVIKYKVPVMTHEEVYCYFKVIIILMIHC